MENDDWKSEWRKRYERARDRFDELKQEGLAKAQRDVAEKKARTKSKAKETKNAH